MRRLGSFIRLPIPVAVATQCDMLKFLVLDDGRPAKTCPLRNSHLIDTNGHAVRGDIRFKKGHIECDKRDGDSAALALQYPAGDCGELTVQTCLLPDRDAPYLLTLELARHHLMMIYSKMEDWAMFHMETDHPAMKRAEKARRLFIEALCCQHDDPAGADKVARECLVASIDGGEELALAHAELLLERRKANGAMPKFPIGCGVSVEHTEDRLCAGLATNFDFIYLPISWRHLAPEESEYRWQMLDNWIEWVTQTRMPVVVGPIISFEPNMLPDWLYIWEHDFDTVRDLIYEHIETVVKRYSHVIHTWIVVSGLHVHNHFSFSFDLIMDLTRMTTMLVKKTQENAKTLVEIRQPFGEYYGSNPRSIPPLMYGDLLIQGAINFDGFAIKLLMGQALPGQYTRDLMQISHLLDQFSALGKPVTLSVSAPSDTVTPVIKDLKPDEPIDPDCGYWRKPWSPQVQSHWLEAIFQISLSKPHVDSIAWHDLVDHPEVELPLGGLVGQDMQPKGAFRRLVLFRKNLLDNGAGVEA